MDASQRPAVVLDCGSSTTKVGFSGNIEPSFVIPTAIRGAEARRGPGTVVSSSSTDPADFCIGEEAILQGAGAHWPVRHGIVEDWSHMERFLQQSIHRHLRVDSEEHNFVLTEPPLNPPENRETAAEIMFETFGVPGLYIGVQAVLALYSAFAAAKDGSKALAGALTGTVIDSGDGCTHVIPVSDGYVIGSAIQSIPIAGRDITSLVQQLMRDRKEPVPPELSLDVARRVKETLCYTAADVVKEFARHNEQPDKHARAYSGIDPRTGAAFVCAARHERFLAPEVLFRPDFVSDEYTTPLPQLVDRIIQSCPIDTRRALYGNIVLSGGSTMFRDFGRRLQRDVQRAVDGRMAEGTPSSGVQANVISHPMQRYAVWCGGSVLASMPHFPSMCVTRAQYDESGAGICRHGAAFRDGLG